MVRMLKHHHSLRIPMEETLQDMVSIALRRMRITRLPKSGRSVGSHHRCKTMKIHVIRPQEELIKRKRSAYIG